MTAPKYPEKVYLDDALAIFEEFASQLMPARIDELLAEAAEKLKATVATEEDDEPGGVPV